MFILNNLGRLFCCYKTANISVKNFSVYLLIKNETYKTAKSILIRPSIKIIYKLQTATEFLIASQSVTGSTEPLSSCTIGIHITYSLNCS